MIISQRTVPLLEKREIEQLQQMLNLEDEQTSLNILSNKHTGQD